VKSAAKSGTPAEGPLRPTIPVSVPVPGATSSQVGADVTASPVSDSKALDTKPDARKAAPRRGK